jgi:sugar phosphate isomerase/epimerase
LNGLGFDGCDLSVEPGGTVLPEQTPVDLVRAIESIKGDGLDLPVITTSFIGVGEPWARNVVAITGNSGVPLLRSGYSKLSPERFAERTRELAPFAAYARAANMVLGLPYPAAQSVIRNFDEQLVGYDFDTSEGAVEAALPRLRMIRLRDVRKQGDRLAPCPLGEGVVDWGALFAALARARFSGPLTLLLDYQPADRLEAIRRDLEFARKHLIAAYVQRA